MLLKCGIVLFYAFCDFTELSISFFTTATQVDLLNLKD